MNRDFRGIWIPADLWLTKELTVGEKLMYVEIESLSRLQRGCFASNSHFAEMFSISASRVSEIISSLATKGFVVVDQKRQGVRTVQRSIQVIPRFMTSSENTENPSENTEKTSSEKAQGKNTKIFNNTKKVNTYGSVFEKAWESYPKRSGSHPKNTAGKAWNARIKEGVKEEVLVAGVLRYAAYCRSKGSVGTDFVMQAARFFGPGEEYLNDWTPIGEMPKSSPQAAIPLTRAEVLAKGPRSDGKVPHFDWDAGERYFIRNLSEGQQ